MATRRHRNSSEEWTHRLIGVLYSLLIVVGTGGGASLAQMPSQELKESHAFSEFTLRDPAKVMTAEACGECHALEYEVWEDTPHATGFKSLHRKASAETIAERMGFKLIKRESLCLKCHYTAKVEKEQLRAVSGVSCESCHGAGRDWIEVHNNYGPGADRTTETPEHRRLRVEQSREAGMRRPSEIYDTARSCYECHTVPEEELVNRGGHSTGSAGFELVERSQGDIRHNFLGSLTGGSRDNRPSSPERRRLLYLSGRLLDLEYSLRGMARATTDATYSKAMSRRVRNAMAEVRAMSVAVDLPALAAIVGDVRSASVTVGKSAELLALASSIGKRNRTLLEGQDGTQLAALDPLIAGEAPAADVLADEDEGELVIDADGNPVSTTASNSTAITTVSAGGGSAGQGGVPAVGEVKRSLRPRSSHATVGPNACSGCHGDQNAWWFDDPHFNSANRFFDRSPDAVRIARLYGIQIGAMTRGDSLCMDCHGSVVSGKERRDVLDGVGCESCHGAAADWLEPHKEGDESLGRKRPGFVAALQKGKKDLELLPTRATECASCHYITDPRLLSAGHPSGKDYDFAASVGKIRHWSRPLESASQLSQAYGAEVARRGPVPSVRLASLPEGASSVGGGGAAGNSGTGSSPSRRARNLAPRPRDPDGSARPIVSESLVDLGDLPPFPEIDNSMPVEEVLMLLRDRLEMLYERVVTEERP
ncbi:MAG: cytochrome c family protein [Thermoanaerobaculia bacterium]|nr:cytochrome c family protein [Thermoanaerobaculia bacterium]